MATLPKFVNCPTGKQLQEPKEIPPYSLLCKNGEIKKFYIKGLAEMYKSLYGGTFVH